MADLAKLIVSLEAQTAKYQAGLERANRRLSRFERVQKRRLRGVSQQFKKFAAAAAAALGVRALTNFTKETLKLVDAQTKAARVIGTTQDVYSGLTLAAGIAGVEQAKFEKALKRQAKVVSDAQDGLATYQRAFDKLGLSTSDLIKLPIEKQFDEIVQALGRLENQTQKVAIASDIFGAKNADLLNLLELGEEGLAKYIRKAEELGVALDVQQTGKIEAANDALLVFRTSIQGVANQLVAALAPSIIKSATALSNFFGRVARGIKQIEAFIRVLRDVQIEAENLSKSQLDAEIFELEKAIAFEGGAVSNLLRQRANVIAGGGNADLITKRLQEQNDKVLALNDRLQELLEERAERLAQPTETETSFIGEDTVEATKRATKSARDYIEAFNNSPVGRELQKNIELFDELESVIDETATPLERFKMELSEIRAAAERNPLIDDELIRRQTELAVQAYQDAIQPLEEVNDEVSVFVAETWKQAARNIQDSFADFFFDPFDASLKDWARNLLDTVRRALAEIAANQLFQLFATGGGGGLIGGAIDFVGGLFGRRTGGSVFPNQSYVVGENGPEVFTPNAAGQVTPGLGGGMVFNMVTNIEAGVDAGRLVPILEQNNRKLKGEIVDELDRGKYQ